MHRTKNPENCNIDINKYQDSGHTATCITDARPKKKNKLESMGIKVCRLHSEYEGASGTESEDSSAILASPEAVLNKHRNLLRWKENREKLNAWQLMKFTVLLNGKIIFNISIKNIIINNY